MLSVSALVAACSSAPTTGPTTPTTGSTPTTPGQPPSGTTYRTLADRAAAGNNSTLGGIIVTKQEFLLTAMNSITGTLDHVTGSTSLNAGALAMVDPDGPAGDGSLSAGSSNLSTYSYNTGSDIPYFSGNYQYVAAFDGSYNAIGNVFSIVGGTYGVVTGTSDIPVAGIANYSGESGGRYSYSGSRGSISTYLTAGDSAVSVDFSANIASVTMNNFTMLDSSGSPTTLNVFDEMRLRYLVIDGNSISGGRIAFYKNGSNVPYNTVIGVNIYAATGGNFYGYDPTIGAPDEVGGVLTLDGSRGHLKMIYLAD